MPTKKQQRDSFRVFAGSAVNVIARILVFACAAAAQQAPQLEISSPSSGEVVEMGQTISVSVRSPSHSEFSQVGVIGEDPLGFSTVATFVPASVSIAIPKNISCKRYMLTANGVTPSGQTAHSRTILIDVEPPDPPVSLELASPNPVTMDNIGDHFPILVVGHFSHGNTLVLTESSRVTYSSSDASVATVDANGGIKATGTGRASITVSYGSSKSLSLSIPVTVLPRPHRN